MTTTRFFWVDVFAHTPLTGNPLALVPEADDLTDQQMLAIAREFNQSETTFLVKPSMEGANIRLRSFTPEGFEVLGAGHNAMGAWIWLAGHGGLPPEGGEFRQQIGQDVLPVRIDRSSDTSTVRVTMRQAPPRFLLRVPERRPLASALALATDDLLAVPGAEVVSTGAEHVLVPLVSREAVDRAAPDPARLKAILATLGAEGCYVYSTEPGVDGADAYARFFNPTVGIAEDPATGTAAGPLAALLVRESLPPAGRRLHILQGAALGRPSVLTVLVEGERIDLSGSGLVVAEGTLHL